MGNDNNKNHPAARRQSTLANDLYLGKLNLLRRIGDTERKARLISSGAVYTANRHLRVISVEFDYDPPLIFANSYITVDVDLPGAKKNSRVLVAFTATDVGIILSGYVINEDQVRIVFFNPNGSSQNLAAGILFVDVTQD